MTHLTNYQPWLLIGFVLLLFVGCDIINPDSDTETGFFQEITSEIAVGYFATSIVEIPEGGYLVSGQASAFESQGIYIARIDNERKVVWEKIIKEGAVDNMAHDMILTKDNEFILTGKDGNSLYLSKFDIEGNISWERSLNRLNDISYGGSDRGTKIVEAQTGGFIIAGTTLVPYESGTVGGDYVPSILRVNQDGEPVWFHEYSEITDNGSALSISEKSDGDFIVMGRTSSSYDTFSFEINEEGDSYNENIGENSFEDIVCVDGNTCIAVGNNLSSSKIAVTKIVENDEVWTKTMGEGTANSLAFTKDGGVVVAGSIKDEETSDPYPYLLKLNEDGDIEWEIIEETPQSPSELYSVIETESGDIVATGRKIHWNTNRPRPIIIRTTANGK